MLSTIELSGKMLREARRQNNRCFGHLFSGKTCGEKGEMTIYNAILPRISERFS
jgi:hypothetical protein